jgi:hypothetical protein
MATSFSVNELNILRKKFYGKFYIIKANMSFAEKLINKILIYNYLFKFTLLNIKRKIFRVFGFNLSKKNEIKDFNFSINLDDSYIEKASKELQSKGYLFIENFFEEKSHENLLKSWPNINYFDHVKKITKSYNVGFQYKGNNFAEIFTNISKYDGFYKAYEFLISNELKEFYNKLLLFENQIYLISDISSSMATDGDSLICHQDGIINSENINPYKCIFFVDGYEQNPILGGATGLYNENNFDSPIFIPKSIRNSLIIFANSKQFYHGFKTIDCPKGVYRKTINFQLIRSQIS